MTTESGWTEDHIQQLLQYPDRLLADTAWRDKISAAGGLEGMYARLKALPLQDKQHTLLSALTTYPGAGVDSYCAMLHIHPATFHRHQRLLYRTLAAQLNSVQPGGDGRPGHRPPNRSLRALHQLPAPAGDFTGRAEQAASLCAALSDDRPVAGIHGMGGAGKTEFAFHVARALVARFPDAQIVLALHGSREAPMPVAQALQSVIRLFRDDQLPAATDDLLPLYRSCLHGKRVLIIADDALDAEHARPLLPPEGSALIVTSRQRFTLPGMAQIALEGLPPAEAQALLRGICARISPDEAAAIAAATGSLPLALRASASILANTPALPVPRYLERLADAQQRLAMLRDPDDPQLDVQASLELSYGALDEPARRALQQAAVMAADFSLELGMAVLDEPAGETAEDTLYRLLRRNMILYNALAGRWRVHDLVRALALKKGAADLDATRWRYARATAALVRELHDRYRSGGDETLASLAEFDRERPHSNALWQWAFQHQGKPAGDQLLVDATMATQKFARLRYAPTIEREPQLQAARAAAQRLGNRGAEADIEWKLGVLKSQQGDFAASIKLMESAIELHRDAGLDDQLPLVQLDLASTYSEMRDPTMAQPTIELYRVILDTLRQWGTHQREIGICINNIGLEYLTLGDLPAAIDYFEQGLELAERIGDYPSIFNGLFNLGYTHTLMKQLEPALSYHQRLLVVARQVGDQLNEGSALHGMGEVYARLDQVEPAITSFEAAIAVFTEIGDGLRTAAAQSEYGLLLLRHGDRERALPLLRVSFGYFREANYAPYAHLVDILPRLEAGEPWDEEMLRPA